MGIGSTINQAGIGIGATLLSQFLKASTWTLINLDSNEAIQGQFPDEGNTLNLGANYGETKSLNRQHAIKQFLNGETDELTIRSRFRRMHELDNAISDKMRKLVSWIRRDSKLGRPPILQIVLGDGDGINMQAVLTAISNITYAQPSFTGGSRQVEFTMQFSRHTTFSLSDEEVTDTRYHRTAEGETYELICAREYGNPLLGDVIRKQDEQIGKGLLVPGDIVKLPAIEGLREEVVTQTSVPLKTAYERKLTSQKANRVAHFNLRAVAKSKFVFTKPKATPAAVAQTEPYIFMAGDAALLVEIIPWHGQRSMKGVGRYGCGQNISYDPGVKSGTKQLIYGGITGSSSTGIYTVDAATKQAKFPRTFGPVSSTGSQWSNCVDGLGNYWLVYASVSWGLYKYDPLYPEAPILSRLGYSTTDYGINNPKYVMYDSEDDRVYGWSTGNNNLFAIDPNDDSYVTYGNFSGIYTGEMIRRRPSSGTDPREIVVVHDSAKVTRISIDPPYTQQTSWTVPGASGLHGCTYDPTRDQIWVTSYFNNKVMCLDLQTQTVIAEHVLTYRPASKSVIYEPASSGSFGTSGDRVWFSEVSGNPRKIFCVDPSNPTVIEDTLTDASVTSVRDGYGRAAVYIPPTEAIVRKPYPDVDPTLAPETWPKVVVSAMSYPFISAHYRAGVHNTISGGKIDVLKDLSTFGRDLTPYGGDPNKRPSHIESVAAANNSPGIRFTGSEHLVGSGFTLSDLITVSSTLPGFEGRSDYALYVVYRSDYFAPNRTPIVGCWTNDSSGYGIGCANHSGYCNMRLGDSFSYVNIGQDSSQIVGCQIHKPFQAQGKTYVEAVGYGSAAGQVTQTYALDRPLEVGNSTSPYFQYGGFQGDIFEIFIVRRAPDDWNHWDFFKLYANQLYGVGP